VELPLGKEEGRTPKREKTKKGKKERRLNTSVINFPPPGGRGEGGKAYPHQWRELDGRKKKGVGGGKKSGKHSIFYPKPKGRESAKPQAPPVLGEGGEEKKGRGGKERGKLLYPF